MITTRIAINGLGRIGRAFLKIALERPELELVAANDISDPENIAYLIKYDSVYRRYPKPVSVDRRPDGTWLVVGDQRMWFLQPQRSSRAALGVLRSGGPEGHRGLFAGAEPSVLWDLVTG